MVTRAKYLSGFKAPSSLIQPPGNKLYKTEYSPGFASWTLKTADISIPTKAMNIPVIKNCLAIIL